MSISKRIQNTKVSAIRKLTPFANEAKAKGIKVYHMNIGQPDIETPKEYFEALKNYDKKAKSNASSKKAYILRGNKIGLGAVSAIHEIIELDKLKEECKKNDATITQYLTAVLIYSIYCENYKKNNGSKPIKVCIPINLKKYFPSNTISNFFSYMTLIIEKERLEQKRFGLAMSLWYMGTGKQKNYWPFLIYRYLYCFLPVNMIGNLERSGKN